MRRNKSKGEEEEQAGQGDTHFPATVASKVKHSTRFEGSCSSLSSRTDVRFTFTGFRTVFISFMCSTAGAGGLTPPAAAPAPAAPGGQYWGEYPAAPG